LPPTRILVADMPRLLRELVVELLRGQADVEAIETRKRWPAREEAAAREAHVVILGRDDPASARGLLEALPQLVVITIADRERVAWRYGLTPYRTCLGELSPAALAAGVGLPEPLPAWWAS
jgi:hypothetical protein